MDCWTNECVTNTTGVHGPPLWPAGPRECTEVLRGHLCHPAMSPMQAQQAPVPLNKQQKEREKRKGTNKSAKCQQRCKLATLKDTAM